MYLINFPFHIFFFFLNGTRLHLLPGPTHLHKPHRHFPSPQHPSAQSKGGRSCSPAERTVPLLSHIRGRVSHTNNTTLMSPRGPSTEAFSRSSWRNRSGGEAWSLHGPRVADRQHLQEPLQRALLVTLRVGRKPTNYPRHRPRAKVGGCGERGAPIALISSTVRRPFLLSERPPRPSWYHTDICRLTLISICA